jgi:dihydrodipicolinate synthase/N-acetylneuraminate lyase
MDPKLARERLTGCYVTVPTPFRDGDLEVDFESLSRHVRFLIDEGVVTGSGILLACGAAGDFSTLTLDERIAVTDAVVDAAAGRVPVAMGAQTSSSRELVLLAKAAQRLGAEYIQVSPPFYFRHTEGDFVEFVESVADVDVGIIVYNTFWTSLGLSGGAVERLATLDNVVGLKWSTPDSGFMEFEQVLTRFAQRFAFIDNQLRFVTSHILGARAIEVHVSNFWPRWALDLWRLLEAQEYERAQRELVRVAMPFMALWQEMEAYTSGDGYLDKLCMELVGLGSSRCRPPTRDVRPLFRHRAEELLERFGLPISAQDGADPALRARTTDVVERLPS